MKNTTRKVICLIMAICIFSAMSTALARSSQTLSAYCAGCVAESGGEIAVWVDVTGKYPRMEKIGTDTIYLYESTDNKTFYCVKIFEADDYPSMMTTNAISYYKTAVTYQGIAGQDLYRQRGHEYCPQGQCSRPAHAYHQAIPISR